jgi:chitinase
MKSRSSHLHVCLAAELLGALVALGCGNAGPTASGLPSPSSTEHSEPESRSAAGKTLDQVVGYVQVTKLPKLKEIDFKTVTHINLAFVVPTTEEVGSEMDFDLGEKTTEQGKAEIRIAIADLVTAAHSNNVKVLAALHGGNNGLESNKRFDRVLAACPSKFVESTARFVLTNGLDGIDIDIENEAIDPVTYEPLVNGLIEKLPGKLVTAAVGRWLNASYRALDKLAFLNVMSYDTCGEWDVKRCAHSTYKQAQEDLDFWSTEYSPSANEHIDKKKLVLGVPFYGYCWGDCAAVTGVEKDRQSETDGQSATYAQVLALWNANHPGTQEPVPDDLPSTETTGSYYLSLNGPQTIARKAALAQDYGGIMIWTLGQDTTEEGSLFSAIKSAR